MATLLETINATREETISKHYAAAKAQFEEQVKSAPLKTEFCIYAGCVSDNITEEIAHRFSAGGVNATVVKAGWVSHPHLIVKTSLPQDLIHEKPEEEVKEEEKPKEEVKEEEKPKEEVKEEVKNEVTEEQPQEQTTEAVVESA
ncbi:Hypothetical protein HVR_LOCUS47 [uncultured virus]|nr:Hypothetical protein HVR_LOCUS47 [uncultured virus]